LERRLQLARCERRHQNAQRDVFRLLEALTSRNTNEGRDVALSRLVEHETLERLGSARHRGGRIDCAFHVRLHGVGVNLIDDRTHHEQRQEKR
jgi:hypothetical protein